MNKHFKEVLTFRALDFKLSGCPGVLLDGSVPVPESQEPKFKNVCALIPMDLDQELESITGLLSISKRQFLVLAIQSAIEETNKLMDEVDVFEHVSPAKISPENITKEMEASTC